jgi:hypothetical protein
MPSSETLEWHNKLPPGLRLRMDPEDFGEVAGNLLDNARIWARSRVTIGAEPIGQSIRIVIDDDGPGIPADECQRVFKPFADCYEIVPAAQAMIGTLWSHSMRHNVDLGHIMSRLLLGYVLTVSVLCTQDRDLASRAVSLLTQRCVVCHGAALAQSGLRLNSREGALQGGVRGPAIIPGNASQSRVVQAIRRTGELSMPPGPKLAALTGNRVLYRDGLPVAAFAGGQALFLETLDPETEWQATKALRRGAVPPALIALS